MTLRTEVGGGMRLPEGRTPHFLGAVCRSFILDIFGSCLFPWGRFCPDVASGIEQGLASLCHGSSCNLYLETNKRSPDECLVGLVHTELGGAWVLFGRLGKSPHTWKKVG